MSSRYFIEKCSNLIYNLLVGEGNAKQRLKKCEIDLMFVMHIDLPNEFEKQRIQILKRLCRHEPIISDGKVKIDSFTQTILHMRNSTASKIIADIYNLFQNVKSYQEMKTSVQQAHLRKPGRTM